MVADHKEALLMSLDYSDFNKEHSLAELQMIDLVTAELFAQVHHSSADLN